jgi:NAD(P)-dependent dehydrogenase (short-subunit alcohol dehydrogenase family)
MPAGDGTMSDSNNRNTDAVGGIRDRVALITGADRNLGKAMALSLLASGANVILSALSGEELKSVLEESGDAKSRGLAAPGDISKDDVREEIIRRGLEAFGKIDIVVNNAAVTPETFWPDWLVTGEPKQWTLSPDFYRMFLEVDAIAPHGFMAALAPGMMERGWGRIINVTTSLDTMLAFWPYGSAKAALEAQTAILAKQLAGSGVTANVLIPGGFTKPRPLNLSGGHVVRPHFAPDIMEAPIRWLASNASDDVNGRRILASRWKPGEDVEAARRAAIFPIAWSEYGEKAVVPEVS